MNIHRYGVEINIPGYRIGINIHRYGVEINIPGYRIGIGRRTGG
jgi:hypothetical protein